MEALKTYAKQNFEQVFILLILTSVVVINYLIPFKLVFLNLYFIVILLGFFFGAAQGSSGRCAVHLAGHHSRLLLSQLFHASYYDA